jgi:hypothetical protein
VRRELCSIQPGQPLSSAPVYGEMHDQHAPRSDAAASQGPFRATGRHPNGGVAVTVPPEAGDSSANDVLHGAAIEPLRTPPPRFARLLKPAEVAEEFGVSRS